MKRLLYLLSEDLGVLAVVSNNDKLLGSLGNDLLLQVGSTATLDGVQGRVDLVGTIDSDIDLRVPGRKGRKGGLSLFR